jgi:hypothetical protein
MLRRIYMLFPDRAHLERAVRDLETMAVPRRHLHTIAKQGIDLTGLPEATVRQRDDFLARLEQVLWRANLVLFLIALVALVVAVIAFATGMAIAALVVMVATFVAGHYFVHHVPHAHLDECRGALSHGELLLLVDVPRWRVREVERRIRALHPDMQLGGISWTVEALGI